MPAKRLWLIAAASFALHAGLLVSAFHSRAHDPVKPQTEIVRVLVGHVDAETGSFHASGLADARIRR